MVQLRRKALMEVPKATMPAASAAKNKSTSLRTQLQISTWASEPPPPPVFQVPQSLFQREKQIRVSTSHLLKTRSSKMGRPRTTSRTPKPEIRSDLWQGDRPIVAHLGFRTSTRGPARVPGTKNASQPAERLDLGSPDGQPEILLRKSQLTLWFGFANLDLDLNHIPGRCKWENTPGPPNHRTSKPPDLQTTIWEQQMVVLSPFWKAMCAVRIRLRDYQCTGAVWLGPGDFDEPGGVFSRPPPAKKKNEMSFKFSSKTQEKGGGALKRTETLQPMDFFVGDGSWAKNTPFISWLGTEAQIPC